MMTIKPSVVVTLEGQEEASYKAKGAAGHGGLDGRRVQAQPAPLSLRSDQPCACGTCGSGTSCSCPLQSCHVSPCSAAMGAARLRCHSLPSFSALPDSRPAAGNFLAKKFEVLAVAGGQEREIAKVRWWVCACVMEAGRRASAARKSTSERQLLIPSRLLSNCFFCIYNGFKPASPPQSTPQPHPTLPTDSQGVSLLLNHSICKGHDDRQAGRASCQSSRTGVHAWPRPAHAPAMPCAAGTCCAGGHCGAMTAAADPSTPASWYAFLSWSSGASSQVAVE